MREIAETAIRRSMMGFYDQLRSLRKMKGYTIREVAYRSGVSTAYISQLENGNRGLPSPEILKKLSEGLNIPYEELMKLAGYVDDDREEPYDANSSPVNLRRFLQENAIEFDGMLLSEEDKEWIERILTAVFWKEKRRARG